MNTALEKPCTPHTRSRFFTLNKRFITLACFLLSSLLATTMVLTARVPTHAATSTTQPTLPTIKRVSQLGSFGPGGVVMTSQNAGWALGSNNVQHSSDGGQTWQVVAQNDAGHDISPLLVFDDQTAWYLVTENQTFTTTAIVRTNDGGQNWTAFAWISPTQFFNSISIFDDQVAWVNTVDTSGEQPVSHLYLVGASTPWQEASLPGQDEVSTIHFMSLTTGWVATTNADDPGQTLHMTSDAGQNWMTQTLPMPNQVPATDEPFFQFLGFGNAQTGFLTARFEDPSTEAIDGLQVYATSDGGHSWQIDGPAVPENIVVIARIDNWQIQVALPVFLLHFQIGSLNEGEWRAQAIDFPNHQESELSIVTDRVLFDSVLSPDDTIQTVYATRNEGATWQHIATLPFNV